MRDNSISMAKGIAILLMVLVHAQFSQYGKVYVNMFHMPLFFFMSGYCFKASYLDNFLGFLWKRVKGAYWPFVKWGLLFLLMHNVFYSLNIYNGEYGYRGGVSHLYASTEFLQHAFDIITSMNGAEQLLGGYWFLHSYFVAAIISFVVIYLFHKRMSSLMIGCGLLLIACVLSSKFHIESSRYLMARELLASFFMVTGYVFKQSRWLSCILDYPLVTIPIGALIVAIGTEFWPCAMTSLIWNTIIPYAFSALAGTLMVFSLCKCICKKSLSFLSKSLTYVGDRTLEILTWHFLCFKVCSLIIIAVYALPIARLAEFPVIQEFAHQGWWLAYFIIGTSLSLAIAFLLKYSKKQVINTYQTIIRKK